MGGSQVIALTRKDGRSLCIKPKVSPPLHGGEIQISSKSSNYPSILPNVANLSRSDQSTAFEMTYLKLNPEFRPVSYQYTLHTWCHKDERFESNILMAISLQRLHMCREVQKSLYHIFKSYHFGHLHIKKATM